MVEARDTTVSAAAAREAVEFIGEADKFGINAEAFEGNKHLLALLDGAAVVIFVVDDFHGGFAIADVGDG